MPMTTIYCAVCRTRLEPDDDHYRIQAEYRIVHGRNETDEYVLCIPCAIDELGDWEPPA